MLQTEELIIAAYSCRAREDVMDVMPEFLPNKGTTNAEKQAEQIEAKRQKFLETASQTPWLADLTGLACVQATEGAIVKFEAPAAQSFAAWFNNSPISECFCASGEFSGGPVRVVGFNTRLLVKILGFEAAACGNPLPHALWYGADHRDLMHAVLPAECKDVDTSVVLSRLGIQTVPVNYTIGSTVGQDLVLAIELVVKLRLFPQFDYRLQELLEAVIAKTKARKKKKRVGGKQGV